MCRALRAAFPQVSATRAIVCGSALRLRFSAALVRARARAPLPRNSIFALRVCERPSSSVAHGVATHCCWAAAQRFMLLPRRASMNNARHHVEAKSRNACCTLLSARDRLTTCRCHATLCWRRAPLLCIRVSIGCCLIELQRHKMNCSRHQVEAGSKDAFLYSQPRGGSASNLSLQRRAVFATRSTVVRSGGNKSLCHQILAPQNKSFAASS